MRAEVTISPLATADTQWASDVQLAATMTRRHHTAATANCRTGATVARPAGDDEQVLVVRDESGQRRGLLVLRCGHSPATDTFVEVLPEKPRYRHLAFMALRMITAEQMDSNDAHRFVIELAGSDVAWAASLLGPCFIERARLVDAVWVDGAWQDLTVQMCDAASWAHFTGASDDDDDREFEERNSIRP